MIGSVKAGLFRFGAEETRTINAAYSPEHPPSLIPLELEAFLHKALDLLSCDRYFEKGMGLMALPQAPAGRNILLRKVLLAKKETPLARPRL